MGYGGAAGGGKTDLLLGLAMTAHRETIIFRKHYKDFRQIKKRGNEIQAGRCRFVSGEKQHWDAPDGRTVEIGALQYESDVEKYQGQPHDLLAFDEVTQLPELWVRLLMTWNRTDKAGQHQRVVFTFNPPLTPEGEWVVQYFAPWLDETHPNPAVPGELRYYAMLDDEKEVDGPEPILYKGEWVEPLSRTFIPARVEDNPVYMETGYVKKLNALPEPLRSQMRWGDFSVSATDDIWQVVPTQWVIDAQNRHTDKPQLALRSVGVDPSRGGDDEFVIAKLYGAWFAPLITHTGVSVTDGIVGAKKVMDALGNERAKCWVDTVGIGSSVYDQLKLQIKSKAKAFNAGGKSEETDETKTYRFANLRSEMWWKFREALDPQSGADIALPDDRQLRKDLVTPRYKIVGDKIVVESKQDIKKRLHRSTDRADAVLQAWWGASQKGFTVIDY